jgi:hypothetical protein
MAAVTTASASFLDTPALSATASINSPLFITQAQKQDLKLHRSCITSVNRSQVLRLSDYQLKALPAQANVIINTEIRLLAQH